MYLAEFDAAALRLLVAPEGTAPHVRLLPPSALRPGTFAAALCGPMWAEGGRLGARLWDPSQGIDWPGFQTAWGSTVSVVGNRAVVRNHADVAPGASLAVQGYPTLIAGSRNVHSRGIDEGITWRGALALRPGGARLAFALDRSGMTAFADALLGLGFSDAVYTDGGSSGQLVSPAGVFGHQGRRPVASWLVAAPGRGQESLLPVALGVGAFGLAWVVYRGR